MHISCHDVFTQSQFLIFKELTHNNKRHYIYNILSTSFHSHRIHTMSKEKWFFKNISWNTQIYKYDYKIQKCNLFNNRTNYIKNLPKSSKNNIYYCKFISGIYAEIAEEYFKIKCPLHNNCRGKLGCYSNSKFVFYILCILFRFWPLPMHISKL